MKPTSASIDYVTIGSESAPYMTATTESIRCSSPILAEDFAACNIPGGVGLWAQGGFYSPGACFSGYTAGCTETKAYKKGFPIRDGETAIKCIPSGFSCNTETEDQRYATSSYGGHILSVPAFEVRWRKDDLGSDTTQVATTSTMATRVVPGDEPSITPSRTASAVQRISSTATTTATPSSTMVSSKATPAVDPPTGHEKSVSSGSIVGIAVGSTFAFLAMAFTVIFFILRRRRSREDRLARFSDDFRNQGYPDVGLAPNGQIPMELDSSPVEPKELAGDTEVGRARRSFPHPFRHRAKHVSGSDQPVELPA